MSLVNLAHVCSHLQNASLARLGLTSIPYTKWHLSLALLLQKQGFLSQVKLGGPSPPASCFGQGPPDDHGTTNHPHGSAGRNRLSPEAALAKIVRQHWTPSQLRKYGFNQEAIDFAQEHGRRNRHRETLRFLLDTRAQLESLMEDWDNEMARRRQLFIEREQQKWVQDPEQQKEADAELAAAHQTQLREQLQKLDANIAIAREERLRTAHDEVLARLQPERASICRKYAAVPTTDLSEISFDKADMAEIVGDNIYLTEREIRQNGIEIDAMGLKVSNQQITLPREEYQDPDMMEAEGVLTQANRASRRLWLGLKYYQSSPVLSKAKMISKPTKRIWLNSRDLAKIVRGTQAGEVKPLTQIGEIMAISTDKGIMEARECVERRIGGQPLCRIW